MRKAICLNVAASCVLLAGCMVPNTYYDPTDPYAYGLRWYDRGRYDMAAQYWDPLVEKGDCDAEYRIGLMYSLGRGKPQDNDKAMALWRKAANANHPKAQGAMGDLYYQNASIVYHHCKGCGIEKDLAQAYFWYRLLEKSARYDAEKKYAAMVLQLIGKDLAAEQLSRADAAVSAWKPSPADCKPRNWW